MDAWTRRKQAQDLRIQNVIQETPDEADQLDQIAAIRCSYNTYGDANNIVNQYMNGTLTVDEAVTKLAEPVEHCYTTADDGRAFYEEEMVARSQRHYHEPAKAAEMWGVEQDFPEPTEEDRSKDTAEGLLWRLWFAVCHVSRKTSWEDEEAQLKLLLLVRAIKARPDPPLPEDVTIPVRNNWVWSSGRLWSDLLMLGASARETWNDSPGAGWGRSTPEIHAWTNTNAFFARLTVAGIVRYWNFGIWGLRDVLEQEPRGDLKGTGAQKIDATLPAAVAWIHIAGNQVYTWICENDPDPGKRYDVHEQLPKLGWEGDEVWTMARWVFWKEKFQVMAERKKLADETKRVAAGAVSKMEEIEKKSSEV